ncbi:Telomerase Cajal body protein 1 [Coemansia spiralis]|uniref:Telomerase Cajal body protein 1 n=2 Tax=Coemansia TaxID=4863 RepID=A0A9W8G2X4_9FUNG|nr:WD40-repeat-containing domain protein [Coemansia spiralis]KAJ1994263.1 Telomerase Cajal body protein 1 [Coemansia umbellata]KAJ2621039.1 Telomerase Cajal body protein 1 [Coemansia sp. RSA 1358]KAJ2669923.1 Telomerase Cajal body protein 1 [Coemansia spiralis]
MSANEAEPVSSNKYIYEFTIDGGETNITAKKLQSNVLDGKGNFYKSAKWSPDGSMIATNSEDNSLCIYDLSDTVIKYSNNQQQQDSVSNNVVLVAPHGETLLDYAWYPYMSRHDLATGCLIESVREHPIQLRDMHTGAVRASYRAFDTKDVLMSANAVAFSADAQSIYSGYPGALARFDVQRPGLPVDQVLTSPSRRCKDGMKGVVSCIAVPQSISQTGAHMACASFSGHIGIRALGDINNSVTWWRFPQEYGGSGVTVLRWSPNGTLWAASRRSDYIVGWDIRDLRGPLAVVRRQCTTQQRMEFDFDGSGRHLIAGEMDGAISIHDTFVDGTATKLQGHGDLVAGVSSHPFYSLVATASGQRHFENGSSDGSGNVEMHNKMQSTEPDEHCEARIDVKRRDSSLNIWSVSAAYLPMQHA